MEQNRRTKKTEGPYIPREDDEVILCRCEEITRGDIRRALHAGLQTINEIKRDTRCGMGLCQGQTCTQIIRGFVARERGCSPGEIGIPTPRTPARPLPMPVLAADGMIEEEA